MHSKPSCPFSAALILAGFDMQAYNGAVQAPSMLLALVTIVPAVGFILTIIPMFFNKYTGKVKAQAQAELEAKREKLMESEEA